MLPSIGSPSFSVFLSSLFFSSSLPSLFSAMVTFLLYRNNSMGFLPFTPRDSPTILGLLWASFQNYPLTHWLPRPMPLFNSCLLHHYSFHDKISFCLFLLYTFTSLPSSMACIRWSRPFITSFWVRYRPSKIYSPKEVRTRNQI